MGILFPFSKLGWYLAIVIESIGVAILLWYAMGIVEITLEFGLILWILCSYKEFFGLITKKVSFKKFLFSISYSFLICVGTIEILSYGLKAGQLIKLF